MFTRRFDPTVEEETPNKRPRVESSDDEHAAEENVGEIAPKFAGVFERFKKSIEKTGEHKSQEGKTEEDKEKEEDEQEEERPIHGLEPLPMPEGLDGVGKEGRVSFRDFELDGWIKDQVFVAPEERGNFDELGCLSDEMISCLHKKFPDAFPVQKAVIPELMKGVRSISPDPLTDVLVQAHTGSGKTVAYGVPIIEALRKIQSLPRLRAIIIVPTNSLTGQVREVIEQLAKGTTITVAMLRTDRSFREEKEHIQRRTPHVLVTTPGRLVDHLNAGTVSVDRLRYLVIDEADRLLNQSFQGWVQVVMNSLPRKNQGNQHEIWQRSVQKLVFSATLTTDAGKLAPLKIRTPKLFILGNKEDVYRGKEREYAVPSELVEYLVPVKSSGLKPLRLVQLIKENEITRRAIVFVKDNETAARLARTIPLIEEEVFGGQSLKVDRCSGEVEHSKRKKVLNAFRKGTVDILVCTDMVSRGIDIDNVEVVINYDLPVSAKDYVHRVGRTARAGKTGSAWNLASSSDDHKRFKRISRKILRPTNSNDRIQIVRIEDAHEEDGSEIGDAYAKALKRLEQDVFNKPDTNDV
ncbi:hypothetical protein TRICI_001190 [Trichomonascus ciferrii]|uniref:ATP-dependent RNA helicase n=1 Tax=Trichomonascus ciferrii TaxID=44093 RepID=A0A642VCR5_9ASCO|nr:hypothetical protein TRICI_001190 [Trichomonascus ciferrii]